MGIKQTCDSEEADLERMTQLFKTLGDPSRVRILFQIFTSEHVGTGCFTSHADIENEWSGTLAQKRKKYSI